MITRHALAYRTLAFLLIASTCGAGEFPDDYFFGQRPAGLMAIEGKPAPTLELDKWIGDETSLEKLRGQVVVIDFWATWCGPCVAGLPTMQKVTDAFKDRGVVFYGIDLRESADKVQSFVDKKKWTFSVLLDKNGDVAKKYNVNGIPHSVVIGKDGKILNVHVGFGGAEALEKQLTEELEAALEAQPATG